MIRSAKEFVFLRNSVEPSLYSRAAHEDAPLAVWIEVIDRYPEMRSWVAHNRTIPAAVLEVLSVDPDPQVRLAIAMKRKLPVGLLEQLSTDPNDSVRLAIARHWAASDQLLRRMAELDPWSEVRLVAGERLA